MPLKHEEIGMVKNWVDRMFEMEGEKYWKSDPGVTLEKYCEMVDKGLIDDKDFALESKLSKYRYAKITPETLHKCIEDIASSCGISIDEYLVYSNWSHSSLKNKLIEVSKNGSHN